MYPKIQQEHTKTKCAAPLPFFFIAVCQLLAFNTFVFAQWNSNSALNTSVCTAASDQTDHRLISDGANGAIIVWTDLRPAGNTDVYAQKLDSTGNPKWTLNGVLICADTSDQSAPVIASDGNGGAIIAWKDARNGNSDIYAQHVNNNGAISWGAGGMPVDTKTREQIDPKIIESGSGESIIVWQDSVSGNWDIYAQKLNSSGNPVWSGGGVAVCTAPDDQKNPRIEPDGANGAIIVWQDKRNTTDYDIYAQRLNSSGAALWMPANGVNVCVLPATQNNPKIKSDGTGGAIIAWTDKRGGSDYDIYAQRIDSSGTALWASNGKVVCAEINNQSAIDIATENVDGAIIAWKDYRNNIYSDIYAQHINSTGNVQWSANGVAISTKTFDQLNPNVVTDSSGAIIVWQDSSSGQWDVYGQKILLDKTLLWGANGKIIANAAGNQLTPKHITDGNGGAIVAFEDSRSGKYDIYAQNINSDGSLGTTVGIENKNWNIKDEGWVIEPNPNDGTFTIELRSSDFGLRPSIKIYNVLGEVVYSTNATSVTSTVTSISTGLPSGIYFCAFVSKKGISELKKIIVK